MTRLRAFPNVEIQDFGSVFHCKISSSQASALTTPDETTEHHADHQVGIPILLPKQLLIHAREYREPLYSRKEGRNLGANSCSHVKERESESKGSGLRPEEVVDFRAERGDDEYGKWSQRGWGMGL